MSDGPDSKILDRALEALIEQLEEEQELAALTAHPYEADPDITWAPVPGDGLPYDGEVPAAVLRMAADRRRRST